jgi:hypothetical protein
MQGKRQAGVDASRGEYWQFEQKVGFRFWHRKRVRPVRDGCNEWLKGRILQVLHCSQPFRPEQPSPPHSLLLCQRRLLKRDYTKEREKQKRGRGGFRAGGKTVISLMKSLLNISGGGAGATSSSTKNQEGQLVIGRSQELLLDSGRSQEQLVDSGRSQELLLDTGMSLGLKLDTGRSQELLLDSGRSLELKLDSGRSQELLLDSVRSQELLLDSGRSQVFV